MEDIKVKVTPSILEQISVSLKKEAEYCYERSVLDTEIMTAIRDTEGRKVIFFWKPIFGEKGEILNP